MGKDESSLWMQLDSERLQEDNMSLQRANHGKVRPISHTSLCFQRLKSKSWGFIALQETVITIALQNNANPKHYTTEAALIQTGFGN